MIRVLAIIEIVPDKESPPEWTPFDLKMPSGTYWHRKNWQFPKKRIYYDARERTVKIKGRWHDAIYLIGEVKRTYAGRLVHCGP